MSVFMYVQVYAYKCGEDRKVAVAAAAAELRMRMCCICGDEEVDVSEGVECASGHFTCTACFESHVRTEATKPQAQRRWIQVIARREEKQKGSTGNTTSLIHSVRYNKASICTLFPEILRLPAADLDESWSDLTEFQHVFQVVDWLADRMCIFCPMHGHGCAGGPFDDHVVVQCVSSDIFATWQRGKQEIIESRLMLENEVRLKKEKQRLAALSAEEREVQQVRFDIVENILTLKCPKQNCRQAFIDFNGCYALTCGRCGCGFCAYCLKECGRDAHAHVGRCPQGNGRGLFGGNRGLREFNNVQKARKQRLVNEKLRSLTIVLRKKVEEVIRADIADLL